MRFLTIFISLIYVLNLNAQKSSPFKISGELKGFRDHSTIYLVHYPGDNTDTIKRVILKSGRFEFQGVVTTCGEFYRIILDTSGRSIPILIDRSHFSISISSNDIWDDNSVFRLNIRGSKAQDDFMDFGQAQYKVQSRKDELIGRLHKLKISDTLEVKSIRDTLHKLTITLKNIWIKWIGDHENSVYTPYVLSKPNFDLDEKTLFYAHLTDYSKNSFYGIQLKTDIDLSKIQRTIKLGGIAPNFISTLPDGGIISFNDILHNNKLVLIDFWASWCIPCREENPNLRKVYAAFRNEGLDILSISFDDNAKSWKGAIVKDSMIWHQASQLKGREESAGRLYGIDGIPASILVDQTGKIIAIDAAGAKIPSGGGSLRGDSLYKKIEEILSHGKDTSIGDSSHNNHGGMVSE